MNKELANAMKERIQNLAFVDKIAGLVKTIETTSKEDNKIIRFPAALESNTPLQAWNYTDLVPNTNKKSIFYFEGKPVKMGAITQKGIQAEATIRLVGWFNRNFSAGSDLAAASQIIRLLATTNPFNVGALHGVSITPIAFLDSEEKLFSKYTYDEKVHQFLMAPFSAFAIDFKVTFTLSTNCFPEDGSV